MSQQLERYLNDHLAGSCGAVRLLEDLSQRQEDEADRAFFRDLKSKVEADQEVLLRLLDHAGMKVSNTLQVAGSLTARVGKLKLLWEGLEPGKLGMFEALEMLVLGIEGKRSLWILLKEVSHHFPEWQGFRFHDLESTAIQQRNVVEERRLNEGRKCFVTEERLLQGYKP